MADLTPSERRSIAAEARSIADEAAALESMSLKQALASDLETLIAAHRERGVEVDADAVRDLIRRALGADVLALNRGAPMDADRIAALKEKTGKALEQAARMVARDTVRQVAQSAITSSDDRADDARWYVWITVGGKGVCRSCQTRHGTVARLDAWDGLEPGKTSTLCGERCRCRLLPCSAPDPSQEMTRVTDLPVDA